MSFRNRFKNLLPVVGIAAISALVLWATGLEKANAELVLDSAQQPSVAQTAQPAAVVTASEVERKPAPVATEAPAPVVAPTMVLDEPEETASIKKAGKSDLLRRERMREELRNEDLLQERLEELRLRDEQKRTEQILTPAAAPSPGPAPAPVKEQVVTAPATERPGEAKVNDQIAVTSASAVSVPSAKSSSSDDSGSGYRNYFSVSPRGGISSMTGASGVDVNAKFSTGIGASVGVTDNVAIDLGYQYSQYGIRLQSPTGFAWGLGTTSPSTYYDASGETNTVNQNVFDVGARLYFLGQSSMFRPYVGGGGGYAKSYINYNKKYLDLLRAQGYPSSYTSDYELSQWLGYLSAGMDIQVSKSISIGAMFKYYKTLSSQENQPINNSALYYNGYTGGYSALPYYNPAQIDKSIISGSIANSSFYSVLAGITFQF